MANQLPHRQTIEQERAKKALNAVNSVENNFDDYKQLLQGAGSKILSCGLGQTIAFYISKGKNDNDPENILVEQLAKYFNKNKNDFLNAILENSINYRYYTNEILAYLEWLKRFSNAKANRII